MTYILSKSRPKTRTASSTCRPTCTSLLGLKTLPESGAPCSMQCWRPRRKLRSFEWPAKGDSHGWPRFLNCFMPSEGERLVLVNYGKGHYVTELWKGCVYVYTLRHWILEMERVYPSSRSHTDPNGRWNHTKFVVNNFAVAFLKLSQKIIFYKNSTSFFHQMRYNCIGTHNTIEITSVAIDFVTKFAPFICRYGNNGEERGHVVFRSKW
jgi:hypothetical protein